MMENATSALVGLALDATAMRQQAIARNIANAGTPGYQRAGVDFESRLAQVRAGIGAMGGPRLADLAPLRPQFVTMADDGPVALDQEVADLSQNVLQQQALLKTLTKHYALIGLAINEGKR